MLTSGTGLLVNLGIQPHSSRLCVESDRRQTPTGHPLAISPTPLDISGLGGIMRCEAEKINEDTQKRLNKLLTKLTLCVIIVPENERGL